MDGEKVNTNMLHIQSSGSFLFVPKRQSVSSQTCYSQDLKLADMSLKKFSRFERKDLHSNMLGNLKEIKTSVCNHR